MLENEVYLGHTVNCKTTTLSYKDRKKKVVPIENQFRFENTHEAIIDKETWDIIQKFVRAERGLQSQEISINIVVFFTVQTAEQGLLTTAETSQSPKAITLCVVPIADTRTAIVFFHTESVRLY